MLATKKCFKVLLQTNPDILMAPIGGPLPVSSHYLQKSLALFQEREKLYQKLFPHDDVNFGTDPCWIRAYPYRQKILPGAKTEIEARIMNHSGKPKRARVALNLPQGWQASESKGETEIRLERKAESACLQNLQKRQIDAVMSSDFRQ